MFSPLSPLLKGRGTLATLTLLGLAALPQVAQAQSLTTIFTGGNRNIVGGNVLFDLNVVSGITVTSLATNVASAQTGLTVNLQVWARSGTSVGFEAAPAGWTLVSSGTATAAATNTPTLFDVSDFILGPGITGIAIRNVDFSAEYTNGNGSNQVYSNADLTLTAGSATNAFFGGAFNTPRVWNGTINYSGGGSAAPEPGTLALLALGIVGGVVARRRK